MLWTVDSAGSPPSDGAAFPLTAGPHSLTRSSCLRRSMAICRLASRLRAMPTIAGSEWNVIQPHPDVARNTSHAIGSRMNVRVAQLGDQCLVRIVLILRRECGCPGDIQRGRRVLGENRVSVIQRHGVAGGEFRRRNLVQGVGPPWWPRLYPRRIQGPWPRLRERRPGRNPT